MTMYAWKCTKCDHEWQATVNWGAVCLWCGADGKCVEKERQWPPMCLLQSMVDNGYSRPVTHDCLCCDDQSCNLPSHQHKRMTGGLKGI